jgi:hypothetical protein
VESTLAKSRNYSGGKQGLLFQDEFVNSRAAAQEQGKYCWVPGPSVRSNKRHAIGDRIGKMIAATIAKLPWITPVSKYNCIEGKHTQYRDV